MTKINISGLSKEKVILALFKNVYGKSEEAKQSKINIMRFTPNEPGIYSEPHDFEISEILRRNKRIDYLGCVKFSINFSEDIIDTDLYDKLHKTGTNGVESAADVIDKLCPKKEIRDDVKSSDKSIKSSFYYSNYLFPDSSKKIYKLDNKFSAEEKLTALLGKPIRLMHLYLDNYCFEFSSEQSYETLQKDAALLASKGITVTVTPPDSLCDGLVKISAKLEFIGSLSDIIAKLSLALSTASIAPKLNIKNVLIKEKDSKMFIIFLDIDGVLLCPQDKDKISDYLKQKYISLGLPRSEWDYSLKACDKAAVELFDPTALDNLNQLINSIERGGLQVGIVMSSSWREDRSTEQLRELFKQHFFSTKIIDKTSDKIYLIDKGINFKRSLDRGEEIDVWIQLNRKKMKIENFLILDDIDLSMTRLFKNNFVECGYHFGQSELERALSLLGKDVQDDAEFKYDQLVNKVSVKICNNENGRKQKTFEKLDMRVSLSDRSDFITLFSKNKLILPKKCADLIAGYDDSREKKESDSNCLIM